jgi:transcription elongation factor Elf1
MPRLDGWATQLRRGVPVAQDSYTGSFYCVKCKDHRDASGDVSVNQKGTRIAKAKCPVCGTNLTRFLPKQA